MVRATDRHIHSIATPNARVFVLLVMCVVLCTCVCWRNKDRSDFNRCVGSFPRRDMYTVQYMNDVFGSGS